VVCFFRRMSASTGTHITLLARLNSPDNAPAWTEFCARYSNLIKGFAKRRGLQEADTEDILQDVLVSLTKAMPGFTYDPSRGLFRSYLKTIVLHAIFKKSCQKSGAVALGEIESLTRAAADATDVDAVWESQWRRYHIETAMRSVSAEFSERDRDAFERYAVEGEDPEDVAKELNISVDLVYQIKSRMTRRLAEVVRQQVMEEG
jgi:RNA polymerase sigma factor (sigma-70 family)